MSLRVQKVIFLKNQFVSRSMATLATKVKPRFKSKEKSVVSVPWKHKLACKHIMDKYFDIPKRHPALIYDFTDDLQIVKPYTVNIKNNLTRSSKKMNLFDFKMMTTTGPIPKSFKSQYVTQLLESKGVIIDGDVYRTGTSPLAKHSYIITSHHWHEDPIPRFDPAQLKPIKLNNNFSYVDKPAGLPCIPVMKNYAYNSLQFMLYVYRHFKEDIYYLHNDIGLIPGVVIICRKSRNAHSLATLQDAGEMKFVYLIRVHGRYDASLRELRLNGDSENPIDLAVIDRLQYDMSSDTSLLRLECNRHDLTDIKGVLSELLHPVVNDWKQIKLHGGHITNSLTVELGNPSNSLFYGKKTIHDASQNGCEIMRNPVGRNQRSKEDYVIKSRDLRLSPKLQKYYDQYRRVVHSQEHIQYCDECLVTRLPLPVSLMSPQMHLLSVEGNGLSCQSKQSLSWV